MHTKLITTIAAAAAYASAVPLAQAATGYNQLAPLSVLTTTGSTVYSGSTIDGTTAYNLIGGTTTKEFTRTTGLGVSNTTTQITSSTATNTATGGTSQLAGILRSANATTLQIPDTSFDAVYRVNKTTGAISTYVDKATLQGSAAAFNVFGSSIFSTGEAVIYDNTAAAPRFRGTNAGAAYDVATAAAITTAAGGSYTYGGFTVGGSDNTLILVDNNSTAASRRILSYNTASGTSTTLLTAGDITGVTGGATAAFLATAFYYSAADSLVYFYDNTTKNILSFNPTAATPASTLQNVLTGPQLTAGPEGGTGVTYFSTFNNQIAWSNVSGTGVGLYSIPEPASMALLGVGGVALLRRRR